MTFRQRVLVYLLYGALLGVITAWCLHHAHARDLDGRYADSPLHAWFDQLGSKRGLCCSFADGVKVEDVDWDTQDGKYRVRICPHISPGETFEKCKKDWVVVPDAALVTVPNRFGPAVVWPFADSGGVTQIRCFMPGAGT